MKKLKKRANTARPVSYTHLDVYKRQFLNNPDMLKSRFRLPGYWKKTYLAEEAAPGLSLKIINSVKTTVRPVESGEIILSLIHI